MIFLLKKEVAKAWPLCQVFLCLNDARFNRFLGKSDRIHADSQAHSAREEEITDLHFNF
ncbi:hypothetical protein VU05_01955 [Desulfobulbus sp. F1]|nr:hypothetical protein [Desulfobulbus sp. F1]